MYRKITLFVIVVNFLPMHYVGTFCNSADLRATKYHESIGLDLAIKYSHTHQPTELRKG